MDTGIESFCVVAKLNQVTVEPEQIKQNYIKDGQLSTLNDLLRAARSVGFKSKLINVFSKGKTEFNTKILPLVAETNDGKFVVIVKMTEPPEIIDPNYGVRYLIHNPSEQKLLNLSKSELVSLLSGSAILFSKREGLFNKLSNYGEFNIQWFVPAFKKYKKLFYDVLLASCFLQIFALVTPLFFQVVMDKVVVHKGLSTLDVLAIGFLAIAVFVAVLGGIRNYVFSHTGAKQMAMG
ncbi:ABC transporter transmembrane domain-containing protein [Gayadomonas joobiniege]|uniref:ABC transporter transmembrane domain-containing protein n=1 Tax=Gayadomonas joobiniege TaxID=1234606 RepID=UPI0003710A71|nr:ABC transporter transmembrane domain-containing protein [Gayadomonas joobiniege]